MLFDRFLPKDAPKGLIYALIGACLLVGLADLRHAKTLGAFEAWLRVLENWIVALVLLPACTAFVALPFKYRDPQLDLRLSYYLGMFVALLFMLGKLRYWR